MPSISTEKKATSQDKKILQDISIQDFLGICHEYKVVENSIKEILQIAYNLEIDVKERIDIFKWLIEMNVGKPKERQDIQEYNENQSAGIFIDWVDDDDDDEN